MTYEQGKTFDACLLVAAGVFVVWVAPLLLLMLHGCQ